MHSLRVAVVVLLVVTTVAAQRGREGRRRRPAPEPVELQHFRYDGDVELALPGADGAAARLGVYLPAGYADEAHAERRYPWAVWLHGRNESHGKFHRDGGGAALDAVRGEDGVPEMIFVSLGVGRSPLYIDGTDQGDQEKLVVELLPAFMAARYRVADDRAQRAVLGVSMGGFGALKIAMRHPDVYGTVAVHSAAIMPADPSALDDRAARMVGRMIQMSGLGEVFGDPIDAAKWAAEMPMALARDLDTDVLRSLRIYFDAGSADRYGFAPPNQALHALLDEREVPHQFELVEGGGHSWGSGSLQKQLRKSLAFVGAGFRRASEAAKAETDGGK